MFKRHNHKQAAAGAHRSGWDYVLQSISHLYTEAGVVLDDFVERTFLYSKEWHSYTVYKEPWVGIVHHASDIPTWYLRNLSLLGMIETPRWQESLPQLKLLIAMAPRLQQWLQLQYPEIPVALLKHPTGRPSIMWTPERFAGNPEKKLLQVGWFCRNTAAIEQIPASQQFWLTRARLVPESRWAAHAEVCCRQYCRRPCTTVEKIEPQDEISYDMLLAKNIVFMEVIAAAANNTVVECVARNTPIVLNRHPGPMYYLGDDYPLFYDDIAEVPRLVTPERVLQAYEHLRRMDKTWIRGAYFAESLASVCLQHVEECRRVPFICPQEFSCTQ